MFGNVTIVAIIIGRPFFSDKKSVRKRTRPHIFLEKIECVCLLIIIPLSKNHFSTNVQGPKALGHGQTFPELIPELREENLLQKQHVFLVLFLSFVFSFSYSFFLFLFHFLCIFLFSFLFLFLFLFLSLSLSLFLLFFSLSLVFLFFVLSFSLSYCTFIKKTWSGKSDAINMLNPIHHKYYKYYKYYNDHKYQ